MAVELYNEHEQSERVKKWIKENGMSVVFAIILALAGIFGWRQWLDFQDGQQLAASEAYGALEMEVAAGRISDAEAQYETLESDFGRQIYTALGALRLASAYVADERLEEASELYRTVLDHRRASSLHPVARLRLSRVLLAMDQPGDAMDVLDESGPPEGFRAAWDEVRGDILLAQGMTEDARVAYQSALDNMPGDGGNPQMLQIKLDHVGGPIENGAGSGS